MKETISNTKNERECVKLIKLTKGYNWEIKIYKEDEESYNQTVERLKKIDSLLKDNFKKEE